MNQEAQDLAMQKGMATDELVKAQRKAEGIKDDGDEEYTPSDEDDDDDEEDEDDDKNYGFTC